MPEVLYQLEAAGLDGLRKPQWRSTQKRRRAAGSGEYTGRAEALEGRMWVGPIKGA